MRKYTIIDPDPTLQNNLMAFEFETGKGWFPMIMELMDKIQDIVDVNPEYKDLRVAQVKEKFGCYDEETEVLTYNGWKLFKDVGKADKIATLADGKYLEYNNPQEIFEYNYSGKMYKLETRGVDLLVTPNHNLYVARPDKLDGTHYHPYKRTECPFELQTYEKYYLKNKKFKKNCIWKGEEQSNFTIPGYQYSNFMKLRNKMRVYNVQEHSYNMDNFLKFLGWYVAEGCADNKRGDISIACCNVDGGKEKEIISNVVKNIGYPIKISMGNRSALIFKIYDAQLSRWLLKNCGHLAHNKKVPGFIKNLTSRQIKIFLNSLFEGDGCKQKTSYILTTVSKQLSDDVQELILKCEGTFSENHRNKSLSSDGASILSSRFRLKNYNIKMCYEINWLKLGYHNTQSKGLSPSSFEGLIDYSGKIYCVEVPNHIIYVRRNGKGVWCGNSLRVYMNYDPEEIDDLIDEYEKKSYHICEVCGEDGKERENRHWYKVLCDKHYEEWIK